MTEWGIVAIIIVAVLIIFIALSWRIRDLERENETLKTRLFNVEKRVINLYWKVTEQEKDG